MPQDQDWAAATAATTQNRSRTVAELEAQSRLDRELITFLEADKIADAKRIENLEIALATSRRIGAAIGIVMAARLCTEDEAFEVLRRSSQLAQRKLREVADEVVLTGALPHVDSSRSDR